MLKILRQYYPIRNIFFVGGEALLILISLTIASWIIAGAESLALDQLLYLKIILVTFVCQVCLYYNDLYDIQITKSFFELGTRLLQALGVSAILLAGIYLLFPKVIIGTGTFAMSVVIVVVFIFSWRLMYTYVLKEGWFNERILILGSGPLAASIASEISSKNDCGYQVNGVVLCNGEKKSPFSFPANFKVHRCHERICEIALEEGVKKIIVAMEEKRGVFPTKELLACRVLGIEVMEGASFYEMLSGKLLVNQINPGWLIFSRGFEKSLLRRWFKRFVDLIMSVICLVLLSPLLLLTMVLIKIDSRGPVFFSQERVGEREKSYQMIKFRSMVENAEELTGPVWAGEDDPRTTRVGRFIRKWRIDELPQIWNVLKGEMSFVGPRPERQHFVRELEKKIPFYGERFHAKPGITGWAQVNYPYGASIEDALEKLNYDLFYIKNMSIFLDITILFKTVKIVIFGRGAR